jgi:hypothetical protein
MMDSNVKQEIRQWEVLLALLPGMAVLVTTAVRTIRFQTGQPAVPQWEHLPLLLSVGLVIMSWLAWRRLTVWTFPAVGYLLVIGLPSLPGLFPPATAEFMSGVWFLAMLLLGSVLLWLVQRERPWPRSLWFLLVAAFLVQPYSLILAGILLLPAALSLLLARRTGILAAMVGGTAVYWHVAGIFDPSYAITIWTDNLQAELLLNLLPAFFLLILMPLALLSSHDRRSALWAALLPLALGLLAGELWRSAIFTETARGAYDGGMWLLRLSTIGHYTLYLLWLLWACHWQANQEADKLTSTAKLVLDA